MMWEYSVVHLFWVNVSIILSDIIEMNILFFFSTFSLFKDSTSLNLTLHMKRILLADLTAANKLLVMRWKPPHKLGICQRKLSFYEFLSLELRSF